MSVSFPEMPVPGATSVTLGEAINDSTTYTAKKGVMLAVDTTSGTAYKATDSATRTVVGFNFDKYVSGAQKVPALKRIYRLNNSSTSPLAAKDAGKKAYVEDSVTVKSSGNAVAGTVISVDAYGVFVWVGVECSMA